MSTHPAKHIAKQLTLTIISLTTIFLLTLYTVYKVESYNQTESERKLNATINKITKDYETLKNDDQKVRNDKLQEEISQIQKTYGSAVKTYENLLKLRDQTNKTADYDEQFAQILRSLSDKDYTSATAQLTKLDSDIQQKQNELAAASVPQAPANNSAPASGRQRQTVQTDVGSFVVDVIAADLNSTRVIVDTASDGTCTDNCPVDSLGSYAARSGAFAAVNGPYFCPASYPSCAGKTNSFDTLLMNKNHVYFNSDNNVYSNVPAVIFSGNSARFVGRSLEWGRDTSVDAVIAAQPMLVSNGEIVFGGDDEIKRSGKGTRAFIGASGSTVYIGVVYNANVAEVAHVLKTMGVQNALNLDSGGSIALWNNGSYLAGPGRNTPFGILFVRK